MEPNKTFQKLKILRQPNILPYHTAVQSGHLAIRDTNGVGTFFGGTGVGLLGDS